MNKIEEENFDFLFPYKVNGELIKSKKVVSIKKKGKVKTEITTLKGLHIETTSESLEDFQKKEYKLPSSKFSKSILNFYKKKSIPKKINTAHLWPTKIQNILPGDILKIKVGRKTPEEDNKILLHLIRDIKGIKLRIDGNKHCTCEKMIRIIKDIPKTSIDYIEDSFISTTEELQFYKSTNLKIAMDEKIVDFFKNKNWKEFPKHINHVVIKLSLVGGINELNYLTKCLERLGISYNLSSTFEGELGIKFLYSLSNIKKYKKMTIPGLDTLRFIKKGL